jgi:hypothetical protein
MISECYRNKAKNGPEMEIFPQKKLTFFKKLSGQNLGCNLLVSQYIFSAPQFEWGTAYGGD